VSGFKVQLCEDCWDPFLKMLDKFCNRRPSIGRR
jgi:hypothetical protein